MNEVLKKYTITSGAALKKYIFKNEHVWSMNDPNYGNIVGGMAEALGGEKGHTVVVARLMDMLPNASGALGMCVNIFRLH